MARASSVISVGLSPLARGTRLPCLLPAVCLRFIPAGAGNTGAARAIHRRQSVYPRWRGEHIIQIDRGVYVFGLSPLARGTLVVFLLMKVMFRFIPAGAGNTPTSDIYQRHHAVYPRWRGEHVPGTSEQHDYFGLSPLARGTPVHCHDVTDQRRFIPAGAGNTPAPLPRERYRSVYPRWRGEHALVSQPRQNRLGLSPLARGTHGGIY